MSDLWSAKLEPNNLLDLCCVKSYDMLLELIQIHISGIRAVFDGRVGGLDHLRPVTDVGVVDIFHHVLELEL